MRIEKMKQSDCRRVAEIEKKCFSVPWSMESLMHEFELEYAVYFAAYNEQNEVVGYVGVHNICGEGEITMVAVAPEFRRKGIAEGLLKKLVEYENESGILRINLEVRRGNTAARKLYEKCGFAEDGVRKKYYTQPTEDAVLMSVELKGGK